MTTKQGVAGKPKVSVRVEQSVSTPRKKVELTDPITFMRLNNEAVNSRRDPNNPAASANYTVYSQEKIENTIAGTNYVPPPGHRFPCGDGYSEPTSRPPDTVYPGKQKKRNTPFHAKKAAALRF